ncbi:uncharacterized protein [Callorhinus ursinus]|uniref:uncharacterized protein n=1 Tax=Callorhinus ursinus TaxID=34884 RepID=UPI003CD0098C
MESLDYRLLSSQVLASFRDVLFGDRTVTWARGSQKCSHVRGVIEHLSGHQLTDSNRRPKKQSLWLLGGQQLIVGQGSKYDDPLEAIKVAWTGGDLEGLDQSSSSLQNPLGDPKPSVPDSGEDSNLFAFLTSSQGVPTLLICKSQGEWRWARRKRGEVDRFQHILELESTGLTNGLQERGESRVTLGFWLSNRGTHTLGIR